MKKLIFRKKVVILLIDILIINFSFLLSFYFRFSTDVPREYLMTYAENSIIITVIFVLSFYFFRMYDSLWRYAGSDEFLLTIAACISGGIATLAYNMVYGVLLPRSVVMMGIVLIMLFVSMGRVTFRTYRRVIKLLENTRNEPGQRVMIVGAGYGGCMVLEEIMNSKEINLTPVCFVDDDEKKQGMTISRVKVMGKRHDIPRLVKENNIEAIIIAIPTISREDRTDIVKICTNTGCKLKIVPGMYELLKGEVTVKEIRDVEIEDLLGRESVVLEDEGIKDYIQGKVVMIPGGGGSIGSEISRQVLKYGPKKLIIFDNYENNAYDLQNEIKGKYPDVELKLLIGSIRDRIRLENVFKEHRPDVIFHAAAHKHVPLMEESPSEAILNNVFGTLNLTETADKYKVKRFVMLSTDKAVNPTNVMGATKRICEMIIQAMDAKSETQFVAVRFGNVLGSNGSVIPLFNKQIAQGGPVTVTDKKITRFFMTIPEAAQLVLQAGAFAKGGEIFILDMGEPVKIYDLAKHLIRLSGFVPDVDIKIEFTGLRPGEKLYEEVLMSEEGIGKTAHNKIFVAKPAGYDIHELKNKIQDLTHLCECGDNAAIIWKLKEVVPTYHYKETENTMQKDEESKDSHHVEKGSKIFVTSGK
ncbi:MAG: nucleoside-diphosphate sugar epimerase [Firmicutes bacterium]|nr:nucleoside-diphosphate sugar epimerase [Bacillota bacterium]